MAMKNVKLGNNVGIFKAIVSLTMMSCIASFPFFDCKLLGISDEATTISDGCNFLRKRQLKKVTLETTFIFLNRI